MGQPTRTNTSYGTAGKRPGGLGIAGDQLEELRQAIQATTALIDALDGQGIFIGGVAVSLLGTPRYTEDVDAMVLQGSRSFEDLIGMTLKFGLMHRTTDPLLQARSNRMLLLRHESSSVPVDISLGVLPFEEDMVREATVVELAGVRIRLPKPDHLILMKAFAGRNRDVSDIYLLAESYPDFDRQWVREALVELVELTEQPWLVDQFDEIVSRTKQ